MNGFSGIVDTGKEEDLKMIRQIGRWKRMVGRFKGILIKLIGKGKDSPKIRQVLLHWGYEEIFKKVRSKFRLTFLIK